MKGLLNPEEMGLGLDPCLEFIAFCGDSTGPGAFHRVVQVVCTSLDQQWELSEKL